MTTPSVNKKIYPWKRFWCPRGGTINLNDGGFLSDPDSEYRLFSNPDLCSLNAFLPVPCLGLLGEPGIGKSQTLWQEQNAIKLQVEQSGGKCFWLNLSAYSSEDRLQKKLFDCVEFQTWINGNYPLHLFLDSLDEALLRIDTLSQLLIDELKGCPRERLFLRIACRAAVWPKSLEEGLESLWAKENIKILELAPLRRRDVVEAALANNLNEKTFLKEIEEKSAVPFAIKPVTLKFLIDNYAQNKSLPATQQQIYETGCLHLCEEQSNSRRDTSLQGLLPAAKKLDIASCLAALTVFSNKSTIWSGSITSANDEDLILEKLIGDQLMPDNSVATLTRNSLKEVLDTGLFVSRGLEKIGWAHKTYAEYLAARYIAKIPLPQINSLLFISDDEDERIIPQLQETAAWLCSIIPELFAKVMQNDPETLLFSDVPTNPTQRKSIVRNWLLLLEGKKVSPPSFEIKLRFRNLDHPDLATQLQSVIEDSNKNYELRRFAIEVAEMCNANSLAELLLKIALNSKESLSVRIHAAYAIKRIGTNPDKLKLKPLIKGTPEDARDDLKGCALRSLWPEQLSAAELFESLSLPKSSNYIGSYEMFLSHEIYQFIKPEDWHFALNWVESQTKIFETFHNEAFHVRELAEKILMSAWEHLHIEANMNAFVAVLKSRLKGGLDFLRSTHESKFNDKFKQNQSARKKVIEKLVSIIEKDEDLFWLSYSQILCAEDMPWMIEEGLEAADPNKKRIWCKMIERSCDWFSQNSQDQIRDIFNACQKDAIFAEVFSWFLQPVRRGSLEAIRMKESHDLHMETLEKIKKRDKSPLLPTEFLKIVAARLDSFDKGDLASWWQLNCDMTVNLETRRYEGNFFVDFTALENWKLLDSYMQERLLKAAGAYIQKQKPNMEKRLKEGVFFQSDIAGYRAFYLLKSKPELFNLIPQATWKNWAPFIFLFPPHFAANQNQLSCLELAKEAYSHSPGAVVESVLVLMDNENKKNAGCFAEEQVKFCWDDNFKKAILETLHNTLNPKMVGSLLELLFDKDVQGAEVFARSLITDSIPQEGEAREKAFVAAIKLITRKPKTNWEGVWTLVEKDNDFGRELLEKVSHERRHDSTLITSLKESHIADLYIWLTKKYPYGEQENREGGIVSPRQSVIMWRDSILDYLINRGTKEACIELKRVMKIFPQYDWFENVLLRAQEAKRYKSWNPPEPEWVLTLIKDSKKRLISNESELLKLLISFLQEEEIHLQGENSPVRFLWNNKSSKSYWPKDEIDLCNWITCRLKGNISDRGIVINREVEIRRGEKTDILVTAVSSRGFEKNEFDEMRVVIEAKGCWHQELRTAMQTQLKDRYLKEFKCKYGLYLIGWFNCDQWDKDDSKKPPEMEIADARKFFNEQAEALSDGNAKIKAFVLNVALRS